MLSGLRVLEFSGIGPAPYAAMLLADMGADVVRVDRNDADLAFDVPMFGRGKRSIALNLKLSADRSIAKALIGASDILIEGFRPGVMERFRLGPEEMLKAHPSLVYGRMTGWGQSGPLSLRAGHDINYIAISGVLAEIGPPDQPPSPPLNLVGDFGGALFLVVGILAALHERDRGGKGQVVDTAMCDCATSMMGLFHWLKSQGRWPGGRGENYLSGGAPFYATYECKDGKFAAVGAIEPQFFRELVQRMQLPAEFIERQWDRQHWPEMRGVFARTFASRSRDEWAGLLEDADTCFSPVLDLSESPEYHHNEERNVFLNGAESVEPAPVPRFSRTPSKVSRSRSSLKSDQEAVLREWLHGVSSVS